MPSSPHLDASDGAEVFKFSLTPSKIAHLAYGGPAQDKAKEKNVSKNIFILIKKYISASVNDSHHLHLASHAGNTQLKVSTRIFPGATDVTSQYRHLEVTS